MAAELQIQTVTTVDQATYGAVCHLLPMLSSATPLPTMAAVQATVDAPGTSLLLARMDDNAVGMLTLVTVRLLGGVTTHVEDVVVDESVRGRGVGRALVEAALHDAAATGATHVDLTSRPERGAANRLYRSMGFEQRETNVYRFRLSD
jgi:ribosomal protein S18 acetylase RimI-like enzyme